MNAKNPTPVVSPPPLAVEAHLTQQALHWPREGAHVLAHFDDRSIVVYQAYRPSIGRYALAHGRFGGPDYSFDRMSWIKPNFLWMMYRCGWGMKEGQEIVLGLRLRREFFDDVLRQAVASSFAASGMSNRDAWAEAVQRSDVRLQWDPDHAPSGAKLQRRAVQLGLRGKVLRALSEEGLLEVIDMSPFVASQRPWATDESSELVTPVERVYRPKGDAGLTAA
ncbi:DUF4291 domain-containing protein [Roseateles chitinivorans]|uniref:DUF4291 domain-containing protein n=1 Tax=Roseateles chitinivorans TaxID=2917965 RepID=UPI003D667DD5